MAQESAFSNAVVTGAAGFTGAVLTEQLLNEGKSVYAIVRPDSKHNDRMCKKNPKLHVIECWPNDYATLQERIHDKVDVFFHLMWSGEKETIGQMNNVHYTIGAVEAAKQLGCRRFIGTGSQAEYGIVPMNEMATEERATAPFTAYGAAKVAACHLSKIRSWEMGMEWIWGRVFSLIGKYEPNGRMLPDLYQSLRQGRSMHLSSCRQNWDYLDVYDAADALIALAKYGRNGEIYNIANGQFQPLKEYTEELRRLVDPDGRIAYGDDPNPFVSLQPSVEKIMADTGWRPIKTFGDSIRAYAEN